MIQLLTDEFTAQYPDFPPHMNALGMFTYYRNYSRFLSGKKRRETWKETVRRAVEYNCQLAMVHCRRGGLVYDQDAMRQEAEALFVSMFNLEQFLSGRSMWVADTEIVVKHPLANFNCSFINIQSWDDMAELLYLLLLGTGPGFKCTPEMAQKLAPVRTGVSLNHREYAACPPAARRGNSELKTEGSRAVLSVGNSIDGWVEGIKQFFTVLTAADYEHITVLELDYSHIAPGGRPARNFSGYSQGPEAMRDIFTAIIQVVKGELDPTLEPWQAAGCGYVQLRPVGILDIGNIMGDKIIAGRTRNSIQRFFYGASDLECLAAKYGIGGLWNEHEFACHERIKERMLARGLDIPGWFEDMGRRQWVVFDEKNQGSFFSTAAEAQEFAQGLDKPVVYYPANPGKPLLHRNISRNVMVFDSKPQQEYLDFLFEMLKEENEPSFVNMEEARRRHPAAEGLNSCGEIILADKGVCNLVTVNLVQFVKDGQLEVEKLVEAQRRSVRAGLRSTLMDLKRPEWQQVLERDRLIGASLTGVKDAIAMLGYDDLKEAILLRNLGRIARETADAYAEELGIAAPCLTTAVKAEGTLSLLAGGVSSGLHWAYSPYYIRRTRVNALDPLIKAVQELGWVVHGEADTAEEDEQEIIAKSKTVVVDFPVASSARHTLRSVSAERQMDTYFRFQAVYSEHNSANTIVVRPEEWQEVEETIADNWDMFIYVNFLARHNRVRRLAPYEAITEEQYHELVQGMKPLTPQLLQKYETGENFDLPHDDYEITACHIR